MEKFAFSSFETMSIFCDCLIELGEATSRTRTRYYPRSQGRPTEAN